MKDKSKAVNHGHLMGDAKKQPQSRIWQQISFAAVLALGFGSGWIIEHSTPPANLNQPKYQVSYGKDPTGRDVVVFRDWGGSNGVVVPAVDHEKSYEIQFGRTPDGGAVVRTRDVNDPNSQWVSTYKYAVTFAQENNNAIIAVREWDKPNAPWITAFKYRVSYERDAAGGMTIKFGDGFDTNAPWVPVFKIPPNG